MFGSRFTSASILGVVLMAVACTRASHRGPARHTRAGPAPADAARVDRASQDRLPVGAQGSGHDRARRRRGADRLSGQRSSRLLPRRGTRRRRRRPHRRFARRARDPTWFVVWCRPALCSGPRSAGSISPPSATPWFALTVRRCGPTLARRSAGGPPSRATRCRGWSAWMVAALQEWVERGVGAARPVSSRELRSHALPRHPKVRCCLCVQSVDLAAIACSWSRSSVSGCVTKYGFTGGGLPSHVRTMAVQPFDNETPTPEIQRELLDVMRRDLQSRLGVRDAPESRSDAVVKGVIRSYDADVPGGLQRRSGRRP